MKIYVGQVYIETDAVYSQQKIHAELTALITPSEKFIAAYGEDWELMFNMSAKAYNVKTRKKRKVNEICGPTVFKKEKDVEYTIFLPFDHNTPHDNDKRRFALGHLFEGIYDVLWRYDIDTSRLEAGQQRIIDDIIADPETLRKPKPYKIQLK